MRHVALLLLLVWCAPSMGADPRYPASQIPEELKTNNYAVVRESQMEFRIIARNKTSYFHREVLTLLNANGKLHTEKTIQYDALEKILYIKASIYDANGQLVKKIKPSEIYDHSAYDGFSLFSDNRYKRLDLSHNVYPYTIEFEYETESRYLYAIPRFHLYADDEVGIQKTSYSLVFPPELKPRYKLLNIKEPTKEKSGNNEKLIWSFENVKPEKFEKYSPDSKFIIPTVLAGPSEFEFEGYAGKMDSWENYGKWHWLLNKDRDVLPEETLQKIRSITQGKSNVEKIKVLYEFMQSKTRYVSVQMGIGGLQPFEAKVVDKVGYGDCKALSNYMVAMLKEVGIKGYFTTIWAGDDAESVLTDFPSHQGNHAIVAVPLEKDTIWLECTSQISPFNFLGKFTGDRYAHMITENGGKIVRTPKYVKEKNKQVRNATITLASNGRAAGKVKTTYSGAKFDEDRVGAYNALSSDLQKKWLEKHTAISAYTVTSFTFRKAADPEPKAVVELNLDLPTAASVTGKRMFLTPNLMNRSAWMPEKTENRKTEIVIDFPYVDIDTIRYHIAEDLYPEFVPQPVKITSKFGEYEINFFFEQGSLLYVRRVGINKGRFSPDLYREFGEFYKAMNKADNIKVVFVNKT